MVLPKPLHDAALDSRLGGNAIRLLIVLWGHLDHQHYRSVKYLVIRSHLGWPDSNIARYIKELLRAGYIERGPMLARVSTYRLTLAASAEDEVVLVASKEAEPPIDPAPIGRRVRSSGL